MFQFINIAYHIDWFAYTEESLYPWNKSNLIMVYELFDVLLNSRGLTPRGSLECNPEIPAFPGEEN